MMLARFAADPSFEKNLSNCRYFSERESNYRSCYQRDRDRILHCSAFRRLKHKTQVFVEDEGDYFRTRLTHTLEVAQVARTISTALDLNYDLSEAIALAHDLGHTPFGHTGEEALDELMMKYGGFDHNAQALRIVTKLEQHYADFDGLNLTWDTLEGIAKHNGPINEPIPFALRQYNVIHSLNLNTFASAEAQVAAISDDIAYNSHDLEDGLKSNLFHLEDLKHIPILNKIIIKHQKKINNYSLDLVIRQIVRDIINEMVKDIIINTQKKIKKNKIKNVNDVLKSKYPLVTFSSDMQKFDKKIKNFLRKKMYYHKKVKSNTNYGKKIIKKLFLLIRKNPKRYINVSKYDKSNIARSICDFIAGMTDRYAINLYKRIK